MKKLFKKYGSFIFWLSIILTALYIFFWVVIDGPWVPAYKFFELSLFYIFEITVFDKLIFHHGSPFELGDSWENGLFFYFFFLPIMGFLALGIAFVFIILPLIFIFGLMLMIDELFGTAVFDYVWDMFAKIFN